MQSRRDQVQAYRFSVSRLSAALASGEPGAGQAPFRRASLGVVLGVLIAVLISGGSVIYGLLDPAAAAPWRHQGSIIVEKETGTRFLYLGGVLHPTANYASALLAGSGSTVYYIPRSALAAIPEGAAVGIPGAPDDLPLATALLPGRWAVCLDPAWLATVVLDLGSGTRPAANVDSERILVTDPAGGEYVIWDNTKYPLTGSSALAALGLGNQEPVLAPAVWLAALPTGPALTPPAVKNAGKPGPPVAGRASMIGELFESIAAGVSQYYVLLADGLAPLSRTEFALFTATPGERPPAQVSPADIAASPASADRSLLSRLPDLLAGTDYQPGSTALCVRQRSPGTAAGAAVVTERLDGSGASVPIGTGTTVPGGAGTALAPSVDIIVPPGAGMIVAAPSGASSSAAPQSYLITGTGLKYPLMAGSAVAALGYGGVTARLMPAAILDLIPTGPVLSAAAARQAVT
jgi:type VII secretion protein EccB